MAARGFRVAGWLAAQGFSERQADVLVAEGFEMVADLALLEASGPPFVEIDF